MQPSTRPRTSSSLSGWRTTNGYSTRQSVASVTCDDARVTVERDVVLVRVPRQHAHGALAQRRRRREPRGEAIDRVTRRRDEARDLCIAVAIAFSARRERHAPLLDLVQPVMHRLDEQPPTRRVVEQIVLQVRVALDHPDVAEHLEQHPGGTAGAPLATQLLEHPPHVDAEQPDDDLAVRERRVVVRNLANARRLAGQRLGIGPRDGVDDDIHGNR